MLVVYKQNGEKFPTLENVLLKENTSALAVCTDWSELFKLRSIHVTPVSRQTGLKTEIETRGKFKTHITNNQFKYVTGTKNWICKANTRLRYSARNEF